MAPAPCDSKRAEANTAPEHSVDVPAPARSSELDERLVLDQGLAEDDILSTGYRLLQRFRRLIATRDVFALHDWLIDAEASTLAPFVSLVNGIRAEYAPVEAALTTEWSTGPVEGNVHRVKLIKCQGYGRGGFTLLQRRVLAA